VPGRRTDDAPKRLRGGLLYQVRITVVAHSTIASNQSREHSERHRALAAVLTHGRRLGREWQVNPTSKLGGRTPAVELDDGSRPITRVDHELTVLP